MIHVFAYFHPKFVSSRSWDSQKTLEVIKEERSNTMAHPRLK